ncbi:MAG: hypothetical protein WCJ29_06465 [bacterium]
MLKPLEYPPAISCAYAIYSKIYAITTKFSKLARHTLGETLEHSLGNTLELLLEANALPEPLREIPLRKALAGCQFAGLVIRVAHEQKELCAEQYQELSNNLLEERKMIGGWIDYITKRPMGKA